MQIKCLVCQVNFNFKAEEPEFVEIFDNIFTTFCAYLVPNSAVTGNGALQFCYTCRLNYLKKVHEHETKIVQMRSGIKVNVCNLSKLIQQNFTEILKSSEARTETENVMKSCDHHEKDPPCQTPSGPKVLTYKGIQYDKQRGVYQCKSCGFCATVKNKYALFLHIDAVHISPPIIDTPSNSNATAGPRRVVRRLIEVAPDKFEYGSLTAERTKDGSFLCGSCQFTTKTLENLRNHLWAKLSTGTPRICEVCGKVFKKKHGLYLHRWTHPTGVDQKCSQCGKSFETKAKLKVHIKYVHRGYSKPNKPSKIYVCEVCGTKYKSKGGFDSHMNVSHSSNPETFECELCGKSYASDKARSVHLNSHTGKKIYSCDKCGMKFTQAYSVVRHKSVAHKQS